MAGTPGHRDTGTESMWLDCEERTNWAGTMSAYIIVDIEVTDQVQYEEYKKLAAATVAAYDGKYIVRGGAAEGLEGDWTPKRVVVLEFPTLDRAKEWWASEDYAPAKAMRHASATSNMIVVEGM